MPLAIVEALYLQNAICIFPNRSVSTAVVFKAAVSKQRKLDRSEREVGLSSKIRRPVNYQGKNNSFTTVDQIFTARLHILLACYSQNA